METLRKVSYVKTFAELERYYEQEEDRQELMNAERYVRM